MTKKEIAMSDYQIKKTPRGNFAAYYGAIALGEFLSERDALRAIKRKAAEK